MTIKEIAIIAKVSPGTVYRLAKIYGRVPTLEEIKNRPTKKTGRKRKYL